MVTGGGGHAVTRGKYKKGKKNTIHPQQGKTGAGQGNTAVSILYRDIHIFCVFKVFAPI